MHWFVLKKDLQYHKECYKDSTNKTNFKRSKQCYEKLLALGSIPNVTNNQVVQKDECSEEDTVEKKTKNIEVQGAIFKKDRCIICQEENGKIHKVSYKTTGPKMLAVAKKLEDKSLFLRLNQISNTEDAIANDVQYHRVYWVLAQRKANIEASSPQELEDINRVVADIDIINMVEGFLQNSSNIVLDMKSLNFAYNNMLKETDVNYKRYLKQLLLENIP